MTGTIKLSGTRIPIDSDRAREIIVAAVRAAEKLITDEEARMELDISEKDWNALAENKAFILAIQKERRHRVRSGQAAREAAAEIFVRAPRVMGTILDDAHANPRHRIESAREIRAVASSGANNNQSMNTERFIIRIDMSGGSSDNAHVIERTYDASPQTKIDIDDTSPELPKPELPKPERPKLTKRPPLKIIDNEESND